MKIWLVLLTVSLGIWFATPTLAEQMLDKSDWTATESSYWLEPWGDSCDGKAFHLFDGFYTWETDGSICGYGNRSFYSPAHTIENHGQWFQIDFGHTEVITKLRLSQFAPYQRLSSLIPLVKDSRLLKKLQIKFSDGTEETVTFPELTVGEVNLSSPKATKWIRCTIVSFYEDYKMAGLAAFEVDIFSSGVSDNNTCQLEDIHDDGLNDSPHTGKDECKPLLVELANFTATPIQNDIRLDWETTSERDTAGFFVWRGTPLADGTCTNDSSNYKEIMQMSFDNARGDLSSGATYSRTDSSVTSGTTYCYLLEDVEFDGDSEFHWNFIDSATAK